MFALAHCAAHVCLGEIQARCGAQLPGALDECLRLGQCLQARGQLGPRRQQQAELSKGLPGATRLQLRSLLKALLDQAEQGWRWLAVEDQIDPLSLAAVIHPMRPRQVKEPAFTGLHRHLLVIEQKLHPGRAE